MSESLRDRRITVGVCGGIAAYKAAELVRLLVKEGAAVQVVMTRAAEKFITRMTMQALSGRAVGAELFDLDEESRIGHIRLADETDLLVIAPATADVIARLAAGLADDLLTTVALATKAPLLLAPAMNVNMWNHPATRENLARLASRGVRTVGPDAGFLACGWVGAGRLMEPPVIAEECARILDLGSGKLAGVRGDLDGKRVLITAGPTHEAIDPVRYLGNRSSGKMGFALARRAVLRGAVVTLVAGPVSLAAPAGVERIDVVSAEEMREAVMAREAEAEVVIKAAAVADFRPVRAAGEKIKKGGEETMAITLVKNPDILAELAARRAGRGGGRPVLVGFAAETGGLDEKALDKLAKKGCDLLVGNDVSEPGSGFGGDTNRVALYAPGIAAEHLPLLSKEEAAERILDRVVSLLARG